LPGSNHEKWAVVACDQFTSEPEYWESVNKIVGDFPSTLRITLPEIYLEDNLDKRISDINKNMENYINTNIFTEYKDAMIYVQRTLPCGKIRHGIVGAIDLEAYDYNKSAVSLIRATEGTVLERIPPRVKIRTNAPIELPHVMVLIDDPLNTVIVPFEGETLYDFDLMCGGGHITGKLVDKNQQNKIINALADLMGDEENPLLFAVGDGNHSLATAKACYEQNKNELSRYALVEIVNIHDPALEFEPIYRILFNVDTEDFEKFMTKKSIDNYQNLPLAILQSLLDEYMRINPQVKIDYIHGIDTVKKLASAPNTIGFILDGMEKSELFPAVRKTGALPRKTFSMGEAASKRYYMECRKIK